MINLKFISPKLEITENIAIVGSSASLLEKENGKLIDSFDEVVRFNRAPTEGYEKYVGEKSTIYIVNPHVFACIPWNNRWSSKGQPTNFVRHLKNIKIITSNTGDKFPFHKYVPQLHKSSKGYKFINIKGLNNGFEKQPTIGMAFIKGCIQNGIVPHIFGFYGLPGKKKNEGLTHYWEKRDNKSIHHNYNQERKILSKWEKNGLIKWIK